MADDVLKNIWPEWRVTRVIGKGSYGIVYEAERVVSSVKSSAAIKIITIPQSETEIASLMSEGMTLEKTREYYRGLVEEFVREIEIMDRLKGVSNIVSVEDYKVVEKEDGLGWNIYIRMELLTPFNDYLMTHKMDEYQIVELGIDLCNALVLCDNENIIHRDIKPENIFINSHGDFKLGDFGIARRLENKSTGMSIKGTYNYMAPEIERGEDYDSSVDTYSLGLVLYKLANDNMLPFLSPADQMNPTARVNAARRRLNGEPLPPPCNASSDLAQIIGLACQSDPARRWVSPMAMKKALEDLKEELKKGRRSAPAADLDRTVSVRRAGSWNSNINDPDSTVSVRSAAQSQYQASGQTPNWAPAQTPNWAPAQTPGHTQPQAQPQTQYQTSSQTPGHIPAQQRVVYTRDVSQVQTPQRAPKKSNSNKIVLPIVIASAVIVLIAAAAAIFLPGLINKNKDENGSSSAKNTVTAAETADGSAAATTAANNNDKKASMTAELSETTTAAPTEPETEIVYNIGDIITFGHYEQDSNTANGKETVDWIVLDVQEDSLLVISRYGLDGQQYDSTGSNKVTWETCTLRAWLNSSFINNAFSPDEQNRIIESYVKADINSAHPERAAGNDTYDKIFLLSTAEAEYYFSSDASRVMEPTSYALSRGVTYCNNKDNQGYGYWWWLRSPGRDADYAALVFPEGKVDYTGYHYNDTENAVRPVMWIYKK